MKSTILRIAALFLVTFFLSNCKAESEKLSKNDATVPVFKKGINISRLFGFPLRKNGNGNVYEWPPFNGPLSKMSEAEIGRLAQLGFDFVRLSVDPGPFLSFGATESSSLLKDLENTIQLFSDNNLNVLVDVHPSTYASDWKPKDILNAQNQKIEDYTKFALSIAKILERFPVSGVALGLMNEPQQKCVSDEGDDWTVTQKRLFQQVRKSAPALALVVTGGCWSGIEGLVLLNPADFDAMTIYDVHFYDPFFFTHQSLRWALSPLPFIAGLSYPSNVSTPSKTADLSKQFAGEVGIALGNPEVDTIGKVSRLVDNYYNKDKPDRGLIIKRFSKISSWAQRNSLDPKQILIGEFGAIRWRESIEDGSRERWLLDVRTVAEENRFGWALWDYDRTFGLLMAGKGLLLDQSVVRALGLNALPDNGIIK